MRSPQIAFLHVGADATLPAILVRSVRRHNPGARIIQCTDPSTPVVEGVDDVSRIEGDVSRLMTFRLDVFAQLPIAAPTLFLDTDMICMAPLDPESALDGGEAGVCVREQQCDVLINPRAMGMNLAEHIGRTLGQVYPYLACAVVTPNPAFWIACRDNLKSLPQKYQTWFGDQEAIRNVVESGRFRITTLRESIFARLLDLESDPSVSPRICHFKGPARKQMMLDMARRLRLYGDDL